MANSDLPEAGAKLTLDLSEWESNWSSVMGDASELQSTIDDLSGSVDIEFNVDDAALPFDDIPESTETEMNVVETEEAKQAIADIGFLALKEKIETIWNIAGNAIDFAKDMGGKFLNPFLDVEEAVARINAQTGGGTGIADLGDFIREIQAADLGDSVEQISDVVITAKQLGLPIQEATTSALLFTHTWSDQDPTTIVGAWGTALQTGIVENMQEATDLMTVFFQQGGNIGGDAVQVVQDNAQSWADMGLNMAEALSIMDSLQQGTGASATDAAKMMQTFDDALTAAAADPASSQAKMLSMLGIDNPKDQGKAIGAETFDGFAEAFSDAPSDIQDTISGMFFGKGGKRFTGAIGEMTSAGGPFADVVGAAEAAATEIDNSLRGAIDDFVLEINTKISELLSSDAIDLPGKIRDLKQGLQDGLAVLSEGGTIGEALEMTLKIPGLSDTIDTGLLNIERVFGQFVITLLEIVAAIQDPLGTNDNDKGTRAEIARLATAQLPFDLKVANPDEIAGIVDQAAARGVTDLGSAFNTAMDELITEGSFDKAQGLLDAVISNPDVSPEAAAILAEKWNGMIADAQAQLDPVDFGPQALTKKPITPFDMNGIVAEDNPFLQPVMGGKGGAAGGMFGDAIKAFEDVATKAEESTDAVATSWNNLPLAIDPSTQSIIQNMEDTSLKAEDMDTRIGTALHGNTVTTSFENVALAAAASFPSVISWFDKTAQAAAVFDAKMTTHVQHILNMLHDLQFLSAQVATGVQQALTLGAGLPGAGGGGNVTNNNVTVNNNVPNGAAAAANGYAIAGSLRPGGG